MMEGSTRTLLRVLRYPPLPDHVPDGAERAAAHEDINLLTVLPASDQPGLELLGANDGPVSHGFLRVEPGYLEVVGDGRLFVRNVCMVFDSHLRRKQPGERVFSRTV